MKRLLRISGGILALSLSSILTWLLLGLTIDGNIANIFALTYPLQFAYSLFKSIFATGANIKGIKEKNPNAVLSGMTLGIFFSAVFCVVISLNINGYIEFMNMDAGVYHDFALYSTIAQFIQIVFSFVMEKLYFEEKEKLANRHSFIFNILNLVVLVGLSLITKNNLVIILTTLIVITIYVIGLLIWQYKKFKFDFNILSNFKYESVRICSCLLMFITYFIGLSNAFSAGEEYIVALNFMTLITDAQWDATSAISTAAKIDISYGKFNFKKSIWQAIIFEFILISSVIILFFSLYQVYKVDLKIGLIVLAIQCADFLLCFLYETLNPFIQLEFSALLNTIIVLIEKVSRVIMSTLIPSPYCTEIGQIATTVFLVVAYMIILFGYIKIEKDGSLTRKIKQKAVKTQENK